MKKSFTLIEIIFVIIIIGLLASVAIPKFVNLTNNAKNASIKTVVNSVIDSIENLHAKWLVNEDFVWIGADGKDHSSDWNNTSGYPAKLDAGKGTVDLFSYIEKVSIKACKAGEINCFEEYEDNKYEYNYTSQKALRFEYNSSNGTIVCLDGVNVTKSECEKIIR